MMGTEAFKRILRLRTPERTAEDFTPSGEYILAGWPAYANDNERQVSDE